MNEQALDLSKAAQDLVELIANQPGAVVVSDPRPT